MSSEEVEIVDEGDWVKEHRKIMDHKIWRCDRLYKLWRYLIMSVKWKDDVYSDGEVRVTLYRGQMIGSLKFISKELNWPKSRTHLKLISLRKLNAIQTEIKQGLTVITVLNYDKYQCSKNELQTDFKQTSNRLQTANETHPDPSKEDKKKELKKENLLSQPKAADVCPSSNQFLTIWNENCGPLPKSQRITESRKRQIKVRLNENPDLEYWKSVIKKLAASEFVCSGKWANIDWLIKNDTNHLKVAEGKYDNKIDLKGPNKPADGPCGCLGYGTIKIDGKRYKCPFCRIGKLVRDQIEFLPDSLYGRLKNEQNVV